jgi:hypothetical protein
LRLLAEGGNRRHATQVAAQNEVVELEMRQKNDAAKAAELKAERESLAETHKQLASEFLAMKNNLLNSRKDTELHKRKTEEL